MSRLTDKAMTEYVFSKGCTDKEIEALLDNFESAMKRTAIASARKAWYELGDSTRARRQGIGSFSLVVERNDVLGQEQWHGTFKHGNKELMVIGTLERDKKRKCDRSRESGLGL